MQQCLMSSDWDRITQLPSPAAWMSPTCSADCSASSPARPANWVIRSWRDTRRGDLVEGGSPHQVVQRLAVVPSVKEVSDPSQGVSPGLESSDHLELSPVLLPVDADTADPLGRGEKPQGLVLANGPGRDADQLGQFVDRPTLRHCR